MERRRSSALPLMVRTPQRGAALGSTYERLAELAAAPAAKRVAERRARAMVIALPNWNEEPWRAS